MTAWGVAIPGLAMHRRELPAHEGVVALQNPEVDDGTALDAPYTLDEVAEIHARAITEIASGTDDFTVIGMSMGGMIAAILATRFRSRLPVRCRFRFLVTSSNHPSLPAVPETVLADWRTATPGNVDDFRRILAPFFSPGYRRLQAASAERYYRYRALGENGQSPRAFLRQLAALRAFPGDEVFAAVDPTEVQFIGADEDLVLGPSHSRRLQDLAPLASHRVVPAGHMVNLEMPGCFAREVR